MPRLTSDEPERGNRLTLIDGAAGAQSFASPPLSSLALRLSWGDGKWILMSETARCCYLLFSRGQSIIVVHQRIFSLKAPTTFPFSSPQSNIAIFWVIAFIPFSLLSLSSVQHPVLITGSGKTALLALVVAAWVALFNGNVLVVAHSSSQGFSSGTRTPPG